MKRELEICCYSVEDARIAEEAGADRIELCAGRPEGGTTVSFGVLKQARAVLSIPIFPMVRPRGGDFVYGPDEFSAMIRDVAAVAKLGFPGVVFGLLTPDGEVDTERTAKLVTVARALNPDIEFTFHRAFDDARDPHGAYRAIASLGVNRLLTSGQQPTAVAGSALLQDILTSGVEGPAIMPGGGVRPENVDSLLDLGVANVHSSATYDPDSRVDPLIVMALANRVHAGSG